jgi:hypothetical protein
LAVLVNMSLNTRYHKIWADSWQNEILVASQMDSAPWSYPSRILVPSFQINSSITLQCSLHSSCQVKQAAELHWLSLWNENLNKLQISCSRSWGFVFWKLIQSHGLLHTKAEALTSASYSAAI